MTDDTAVHTSGEAVGDGWIEWHGGRCPVSSDALVEVRYRAEEDRSKGVRISWSFPAGRFAWWHDGKDDDIIAYRKALGHD